MALPSLSLELLSEILGQHTLTLYDLSCAARVGKVFNGDALAGALRLRAARDGHTHAPELSAHVMLWHELRHRFRPWQGRAAAGWYHAVFVTDNGQLMISGRESEDEDEGPCGMLGAGISDEPWGTDQPVPVAALGGVCIRSVAAGESHTLALSTAGSVYAWGSSSHGRLGLHLDALNVNVEMSDDGVVGVPTKLDFGQEVVQVSVAELCGLAVTACGALYTWGDGEYGQLGHGDTLMRYLPTRVAALEHCKVVTASMAYRCTALTESEAFCWGLGENGDIPGVPACPEAKQLSPVRLDTRHGLPSGVKLCAVSGCVSPGIHADQAHSLACMRAWHVSVACELPAATLLSDMFRSPFLSDLSRNLFLSDMGEVFRVAYAEEDPDRDYWPKCGTIPFIELVSCLHGTRIVSIAAGQSVEIVISHRGEAFTLASGSAGCLTMEQVRRTQPSRVANRNYPSGLRGVRAACVGDPGVTVLIAEEEGQDADNAPRTKTVFYSLGRQNDRGFDALGQGDHVGVVGEGGTMDFHNIEAAAPELLGTLGRVLIAGPGA